MIAKNQITGLILSGGQSSRMRLADQKTLDKGLLQLNGRPLVAYCRDHLAPWVDQIFISANKYAEAYKDYGTVVSDDAAYGVSQGPLVGIASVLAQINTPWLCVLPVESPVVPPRMVPRLAQSAQAGNYELAYVVTKRVHPLCMLMHVSCLPKLRAYLLSGERRVQAWLALQQSIGVRFNAKGDEVWNVNTPADLENLQAYLKLAEQ